MISKAPDKERFQLLKQQAQKVKTEALILIESAYSRGEITQAECEQRKENELHYYTQLVGDFAHDCNVSLISEFPQFFDSLNQEEILVLGYSDPALRQWIHKWKNKVITWEQATYGIIWSLLSENQAIRKSYTELIEKHPLGAWLKPNDYTLVIKKEEWERAMGVIGMSEQ